MKLFKIAKEGDSLGDAIFVIRYKNRRSKHYGPSLTLIKNKVVCKVTDIPVIKRSKLTLYFAEKPFISLSKTAYLQDFSRYLDPVSKYEGFLKEKDISKEDLSIVSLNDYELKKVTIQG